MRNPICICRDDVTVERIRPKLASGASFAAAPANAISVGLPKFARLNRLNTSRRRSARAAAAEADAPDRRDVHRAQVRAAERAARAVAERALRLQDERRRIEPLIGTAEHRALRGSPGRQVRPIEPGGRRDRRRPLRSRPVVLHEHRQRLAAAHRADGRDLPAVEQRARRAGQVARERNVPRQVHDPVVRRVPVGRPLVVVGDRLPETRPSCRWSSPRRTWTPASCPRCATRCRTTAARARSRQVRRSSTSSARYQESPSLLFSSIVPKLRFGRGRPAAKNGRPSGPGEGAGMLTSVLRNRCVPREPA